MKKIKNDDVRGEQEEEQTSSSPPVVKISATVFNIDSGLSFYEVRFRDKFGNYQTQLLNASKFLKPKQVVESLIDSHADLPDNAVAAQKIVKPALASKSSRVKRRTARSGFLDQHNFSYPGGSYGPLADTLEHAGRPRLTPRWDCGWAASMAGGRGYANPANFPIT